MKHLGDITRFYGAPSASKDVAGLVGAALDAWQAQQNAERAAQGKTAKTYPYVSDAGKCIRAIFHSLIGTEPTHPMGLDGQLNIFFGQEIERSLGKLISALEDQGVTYQPQVRCEIPAGETVVVGKLDFLFDRSNRIIELKTTSSRALGMMIRHGEQGRDEHRRQLNLYLHASQLGLLKQEDGTPFPPMDSGHLVYVTKDATRGEPVVVAWEVPYNRLVAEADVLTLGTTYDLAQQGMDPGVPGEYLTAYRENGKLHWRCNYCHFKGHCWELTDTGRPLGPRDASKEV